MPKWLIKKTAVIVIISMRALVLHRTPGPKRPCDIYIYLIQINQSPDVISNNLIEFSLHVFTEFAEFSDKNYLSLQ